MIRDQKTGGFLGPRRSLARHETGRGRGLSAKKNATRVPDWVKTFPNSPPHSRLLTRMAAKFLRSRLSILIILLAIWQIAVGLTEPSPLILPPPLMVLRHFGTHATDELLPATGQTMQLLATSMLIIVFLGLVLALLASATFFGRQLFLVITSTMNPIPAIALLPLALLWFGFGQSAILFVVVFSGIWAMALNLFAGFEGLSKTLLYVSENLALRPWEKVRSVYVPGALPQALAGLRVSWANAWRTVIAAELVFGAIGSGGGLGWYIFVARYNLDTVASFSGLLVIVLVGLLVDYLLQELENRTIRRWGLVTQAPMRNRKS